MITIKYLGRLGNKLFEYGYARIASECAGLHLPPTPIAGFAGTNDDVSGLHIAEADGEPYTPKQRELPEELPKDKRLVVGGYYQQWETMLRWREKLKVWLSLPLWPVAVHEDDVLIHVRLGDYIGKHESPDRYRYAIPSYKSFYEPLLGKLSPRRVFVVSNEPTHPYVCTQFDATILNLQEINTLRFMASFRRIVISQSTFSWWGAFLSRASEVYLPMPANSVWEKGDDSIWTCDMPGWKTVPCESINSAGEAWSGDMK